MCVEINLKNYSADECTCKYVHAVQSYTDIHIQNIFYIIEREREREREIMFQDRNIVSPPFLILQLFYHYDIDNLKL